MDLFSKYLHVVPLKSKICPEKFSPGTYWLYHVQNNNVIVVMPCKCY